ncbi:MAG: hypothetical protein JWM99_4369 [Verrucomicrobiales bacterium]|nr:hypothetical protein [Verrucomicrobiales bacterium]
MAECKHIIIVSDIHYAGATEKRRGNYELAVISNPMVRFLTLLYRRYIWLRDPFAHNHLLENVLQYSGPIDWCVANGDYSCDSAFVGISDDPSLESAKECLGKLRERFGSTFRAVPGDHEFGKISLAGGRGGLRFESWKRLETCLQIEPFWTLRLGGYVLMGVTSSLIAFPTYEPEALSDERAKWIQVRDQHMALIRESFAGLKGQDRVLLFCHDPTALPYLAEDRFIAPQLERIERTIIGHLHTGLVLWQSKLLAGVPKINFLGNAVRRMSAALNRAKHWRQFRVLLCPSLSGSELLKDGGFYTAKIDPSLSKPAEFRLHRIRR